ncbi:MAG TPA: DUF4279 domain-containing protein [Acetobacteraceae bacterium]|nr:DUF4279 domain-containing protein [Acetobacteraceae bacterium]
MSDPSEAEEDGVFALLDFKGEDLDPAPLISLIPLTPVRPRKKGDPLGPDKGGKVPVAKTGYCGFTTAGKILSKSANDHVSAILDIVDDRIVAIREVMSLQSLAWKAVLFEGRSKEQVFSSLNPELSRRASGLGLPLLPKGEEAMTFIGDICQSVPQRK